MPLSPKPSQQLCFLFFNSLGFLLKSTWGTVRVTAREYYRVFSVGGLRRIYQIPHPQWLCDGRGAQFQLTNKDEILLKGVAFNISIFSALYWSSLYADIYLVSKPPLGT